MVTPTLTRKQFLLGAGATAGAIGLSSRHARAARPRIIKFGIDLAPQHLSVRNVNAVGQRIAEASKGRLKLQVFPANQLGNDDHMLSEVRSGAIEMMGIGDNILASLMPSAAIDNLGFAFKTIETAWTALDGKVGEVVCADIARQGIQPMRRIWDGGFRELTSSTHPINTPADLAGFKIRVPPSPISVSLFKHLGAAPTSMNVAELYTALQTRVVDGQENPLGNIEAQKYFQVQKYCSLTNHMWFGYWMIASHSFWQSLPEADRAIIADAFDAQAPRQRVENNQLNTSLQARLTAQGMIFNRTDAAQFQAVLRKSGFYSTWKKAFSPALWAALEQYTGPLV